MHMRNLLTTKQAAEMLGVTTRQITRWALNGDVPHAHKIEGLRGAYLFDIDTLEEIHATRTERLTEATS